MTGSISAADLARVDQVTATHNELLDHLIATAPQVIAEHGREYAAVSLARSLRNVGRPGNIASLAAVAVLRLLDDAGGLREPRPWGYDLRSGSGGEDAIPVPNGCMACGIDQRGHFSRWHRIAGRHIWIAPSNELRLARMRARREARQITRMRARKAACLK